MTVRRRARGPDLVLYAVCRGVVAGFCRVFWRLRVEGRERLPAGPFVLAPVHRSNIDTPLVGAITTRRLRYMGKDSLWKYRAAGWFLSAMGAFPVRRGRADREALRRCLEVLAGGEPVVMFPEGTRRSGPIVHELYEGPAYVAMRAGVPLVPVGIGGSERAMPKGTRLPRPVRVHVVVGEPIVPVPAASGRAPRRAVHQLTDRLRHQVQVLFDEAQAKAGVPGR